MVNKPGFRPACETIFQSCPRTPGYVGNPEVIHFNSDSEGGLFILHAASADESAVVYAPRPTSDLARHESPADARRACPSALSRRIAALFIDFH
jgi:hypothetical protein